MHTMARASFVTPVFIFGSIRAGSGKTSLLASAAVFLNNSGNRVAIIDLDASTPHKLKNNLPQSISIHEYPDLQQISAGGASRFQRSFYFTETGLISYFPAMNLAAPEMLFHDTALRDFFLQTRANFDYLLVNYPAGDKFCLSLSELSNSPWLWQGNLPVNIIVSTSELNSLLKLDGITRKKPALSFQLREKTMLVFNRVPGSLEEQKLSDTALTAGEIKQIFKYPNLFFIGHNEEFSHQKNIAAPIVLKTDSLMHLNISRLLRALGRTGFDFADENEPSEYTPCLDGALLERLSPFLENFQQIAARRLLTNPKNVQVFLEESSDSFRIRLRLAGRQTKTIGISGALAEFKQKSAVFMPSPEAYHFRDKSSHQQSIDYYVSLKTSSMQIKPVYRFSDCFDQGIFKEKPLCKISHPESGRFPSPILFRHSPLTEDIPTLSQILGFVKKKYRKFVYIANAQLFAVPGVTHFFIPPEFSFRYGTRCLFTTQFSGCLKISHASELHHENSFEPAYRFSDKEILFSAEMPDLFARNQPLILPEWESTRSQNLQGRLFPLCQRNLAASDFSFPHLPAGFITPVFPDFSKTHFRFSPQIFPLDESKSRSFTGKNLDFPVKWFNKATHDFALAPVFPKEGKTCLFIHLDLFLGLIENKPEFSLHPRFSHYQPTLSQKIEGNTVFRSSPKVFSHLHVSEKPNSIPPRQNSFSARFKLEITLLEHFFPVGFSKRLAQNPKISPELAEKPDRIDHKLFFVTDYQESLFDNNGAKALSLPETASFRQVFRSAQQTLKFINLKFSGNKISSGSDILAIRLVSKTDLAHRLPPGKEIYGCNHVCGVQLRGREIARPGSLRLMIKHDAIEKIDCATVVKNIGKNHINSSQSIENFYSEPEKPFAAIPWKRGRATHSFADTFPAQQSAAALLFGTTANDRKPVFSGIKVPILYNQSYRIFRKTLAFSDFNRKLDEILQTHFSLVDAAAEPGITHLPFSSHLEPYEVRIARNLPLRAKKQFSPEINVDIGLSNMSEILCSSLKILSQKCIKHHGNYERIRRKGTAHFKRMEIKKEYPFFKPSFDAFPAEKPQKSTFRVPPPDPLQEIFQNLLYNLRSSLLSALPMSFKPFTVRRVEFSSIAGLTPLHFGEGPLFARRILHAPEKLRFSGIKRDFRIIDPRFKDLMNLARQTSRKFSQVNGQTNS